MNPKLKKDDLLKIAAILEIKDVTEQTTVAQLETAIFEVENKARPEAVEKAVAEVIGKQTTKKVETKKVAKVISKTGNEVPTEGKRIVRIILQRPLGEKSKAKYVAPGFRNRAIPYGVECDIDEKTFEVLRNATAIDLVANNEKENSAGVISDIVKEVPRFSFSILGQVMPNGNLQSLKFSKDGKKVLWAEVD